MLRTVSNQWWTLALRGLVAIIFGVMAFMWPQLELLVLVLFFGGYVLTDGVLALIVAARSREPGNHRLLMALEGLAGVVIGVITFLSPEITGIILLYLIAAWALITGVLEVALAVQLRKEIDNEWMLILTGILSILFGVLLILSPTAGALAVAWMIGAYAIFFGMLMVGLAFSVRNRTGVPA